MDFKNLEPELLKGLHVEGDTTFVNSLQSEHFGEPIRELSYRIYLYPNERTELLLSNMLEGRQIIASMTGFKTFAERALKGTLAESPGTLLHLYMDIIEKSNSMIWSY
ncbi:mitochondrial intermediate peptidase-like [Ruditapes philippinarum]|uniref:mitochondrial intermediate peptidase-like n=1 Tax=Ruditapes philippinarum TaxID=129788 RepID=UPI00295BBE6D|nr:mitochondrial intermediate peptidase-like [Ruditapes philippinarum]